MFCCSQMGLNSHHDQRSPHKQRVQLQLIELEGVTLSNGVLFAKIRLLNGGRFCAYSARKEIRDNKVAWVDQSPMEFACRLGDSCPGVPPVALRVSVRKEERGGRSYSKLGFAVLNLTELLGTAQSAAGLSDSAEHSCILSPYNQRQRLDNSTLRLGIRRLTNHATPAVAAVGADSAAVKEADENGISGAAAAAVAAKLIGHGERLAISNLIIDPNSSTANSSLATAAVAATSSSAAAAAHCRNSSNFSFGSFRTHSRTNSLEQDTLVPSQSSSVPSFDLHLPSSLERKRVALTSTREANSRIANTRTDNFKIVREVLEQEGIRIVGPPITEHGRTFNYLYS